MVNALCWFAVCYMVNIRCLHGDSLVADNLTFLNSEQINYSIAELRTSVYIDANSGRLIGHSNDDKRLLIFSLCYILWIMEHMVVLIIGK